MPKNIFIFPVYLKENVKITKDLGISGVFIRQKRLNAFRGHYCDHPS